VVVQARKELNERDPKEPNPVNEALWCRFIRKPHPHGSPL